MPATLTPGLVLGRCELLLPIGQGGMAQVWAARWRGTRGFRKIVAVKTIVAEQAESARLEEMFLEEATIAAQIHHPNVVNTIELGEEQGVLYLAMEWVQGEPLSAFLTRAQPQGGIPLSISVNLIGQVCKGLHAAHELRDDHGEPLGIVHRDVSAQNVLVTYSGSAKLADFGIAKATARTTASLTQDGELKGKVGYMAPEQVRGRGLDRRTDLFALGVLLYVLTTGTQPFRAENAAETVFRICSPEPPVKPSAIVDGYPAGLEAVVMKALEKRPSDRYADALELRAALERALPEAFKDGMEAENAQYMSELFGTRAADRLRQLREAQQELDKDKPPTSRSGPHSVGSLGAMAIGPDSESGLNLEPSLTVDPPSQSTRASLALPSAPQRPPERLTERRGYWLMGAIAIAAVVVLGIVRGGSGLHGASSAASVGPEAGSGHLLLPTPVATPPKSSAVPTPSATDDASAPTMTKTGRPRAPVVERHAPPVIAGRSAPAAPGPVAAPQPPAPAAPRKANPFDPNSFGARQ